MARRRVPGSSTRALLGPAPTVKDCRPLRVARELLPAPPAITATATSTIAANPARIAARRRRCALVLRVGVRGTLANVSNAFAQ